MGILTEDMQRRGYRFKGTGVVHADGEIFERGIAFYDARGTVNARERIHATVIVAVERALAVTSPSYDIGMTADELREHFLRRFTTGEPARGAPDP